MLFRSTQYVGLKEKFNKVESSLKEQISGLEEKLKSAVTWESYTKLKQELDETKETLQRVSEELNAIKEKTVSEKRGILKEKGISEEKLAAMSEKELDALLDVVSTIKAKPAPDLGVGGGMGNLAGSPMELATLAYSKQKK